MSLQKLFTDIGDYIEAGLKAVGIGDETSAAVGNEAAAILAEFLGKWASDEKKLLLVAAGEFAATVGTVGITAAADSLVSKLAADSLAVTQQDAMDAIRVHLMPKA